MSEWFEEELEMAELGDRRLNERFESILEALTAQGVRTYLGNLRSFD